MPDDIRSEDACAKDRCASETEGLQFYRVPITFFPEDMEKMESMSLEEQVAFLSKLKEENRYIEGAPEEVR